MSSLLWLPPQHNLQQFELYYDFRLVEVTCCLVHFKTDCSWITICPGMSTFKKRKLLVYKVISYFNPKPQHKVNQTCHDHIIPSKTMLSQYLKWNQTQVAINVNYYHHLTKQIYIQRTNLTINVIFPLFSFFLKKSLCHHLFFNLELHIWR